MMRIPKSIILVVLFPLHVFIYSFSGDVSVSSIIIGSSFAIYIVPCIRYYLGVQREIGQSWVRRSYILAGTAIVAAALLVQFIPREYRVSDQQAVRASPFTPEWVTVSGADYGWPASVYVVLEHETSCCGREPVFYGNLVFNAVFPAAALFILAFVASLAARCFRRVV